MVIGLKSGRVSTGVWNKCLMSADGDEGPAGWRKTSSSGWSRTPRDGAGSISVVGSHLGTTVMDGSRTSVSWWLRNALMCGHSVYPSGCFGLIGPRKGCGE